MPRDHQNFAANIIAKFGGVRRCAEHLKLPPTTVSYWQQVGHIPAKRQAEVLARARACGLDVSPSDFFGPAPTEVA